MAQFFPNRCAAAPCFSRLCPLHRTTVNVSTHVRSQAQLCMRYYHILCADLEPGYFLCQDAGAAFCVWLNTEDSNTRTAFGNAVSLHYPLRAAATSVRCDEFTVTMVDMRTRRYYHFPPGSDKSACLVSWRDAMAKTTHMLFRKTDEV